MIKSQTINYTIKKSSRARRMRLAVYRDGSVVLTAPIGLETSVIEDFVSSKKQWLYKKISFYKSVKSQTIRVFSKEDYFKHRNEARVLAEERVGYFNTIYGFDFNGINIKNQKTRWGSCSRKKNLNFNYKFFFYRRYRGITS